MIKTLAPVQACGARSAESVAAEFVAEEGPLRSVWGCSPAIIRQAGLAEWFPTVAELLSAPYVSLLGPPYISLMANGRQLNTDRYCRKERVVMYSKAEQMLDIDRVKTEVAAGASIKFNRMELWCPPIARMAAAISQARGMRVKVWGFQSTEGEQMVPAHRDPAHVLAVQLDGDKDWRLDGPCPSHSWSGLAPVEPSQQPLTDALTPGDVLYMPHGFAHSAAASTATSYHVTFAIEGTTAGELRTQIVRLLYDRVDRADATEITTANVAAVVDGIRRHLGALAEQLSGAERNELTRLTALDLQATLDRLFSSAEQPEG